MKTMIRSLLLLLVTCPVLLTAGNKPDSTDSVPKPKSIHRNVIKFNPTPMLLWGETKNITLTYERLVRPNQSFSVSLGYLVYPKIITDTVLGLIALTNSNKWGINVAVDYRFYPFKRNLRPPPDGLYIGPYLSYYGNHFENNFDLLLTAADQNGRFTGNLNIVNLGFELGYQFIFWKRLSVDLLLFGPSITYYSANLSVEGSLNQEEVDEITIKVAEKLMDRFPILGTLFTEGELSQSGFQSKFGMGFRYNIQIGFHF